jgi:RimJ/RimL family protein N-acetyltransferase
MARLPAPDPPLTDGAVVLRRWREDDIEQIVRACQDPEIPRWTSVPDPYTEADARAWVAGDQLDEEPPGDLVSFAIASAEDDSELLGSIGVMHVERGGGGEIGYWGAPWSRGRGVMTAAVRLLAVWAIDEFDLRRVELVIDVENAASCRVAERVGFMHEGVLRQYSAAKGIWRDQAVYSVLPGELEPGLRPQM